MLHKLAHIGPALTATGLGPLLIRSMVGVVFVFHGAQKLFGWFGGGGIAGTAQGFESLGLPLPTVSVVLAGGAEFFGGILLILGLATRPSALVLTFTMLVAAFVAHGGAFDIRQGGMEYALTLAVVCLGLAFTGPGPLALDASVARGLLASRTAEPAPGA